MALAPAPDIIKVLHGHAPSAYFFAREGYIPFRPAMAGKRKSLRMTGKARAGNRCEAPGGAKGRGLRQRADDGGGLGRGGDGAVRQPDLGLYGGDDVDPFF